MSCCWHVVWYIEHHVLCVFSYIRVVEYSGIACMYMCHHRYCCIFRVVYGTLASIASHTTALLLGMMHSSTAAVVAVTNPVLLPARLGTAVILLAAPGGWRFRIVAFLPWGTTLYQLPIKEWPMCVYRCKDGCVCEQPSTHMICMVIHVYDKTIHIREQGTGWPSVQRFTSSTKQSLLPSCTPLTALPRDTWCRVVKEAASALTRSPCLSLDIVCMICVHLWPTGKGHPARRIRWRWGILVLTPVTGTYQIQ